jgi:small-conductance mechanosensitive channel
MSVVIVFSAFLLSACVTGGGTRDSSQASTVAEGAGIGATVGGMIGLLVGDNKESAAIGAFLGGAIGAVAGSEVARRKDQYATTEALLEGETRRTAKFVAEVRKVNQGLRTDIDRHQREIASLETQIRAGKNKRSQLQAQRAEAKKQGEDANQALEGVKNELKVAYKLYDENKGQAKMKRKLKAYEIKIAALEREKGELEKYAGALLAMGTALSR